MAWQFECRPAANIPEALQRKLSVLLAPARKVPTAGLGEGSLKEACLGSSEGPCSPGKCQSFILLSGIPVCCSCRQE